MLQMQTSIGIIAVEWSEDDAGITRISWAEQPFPSDQASAVVPSQVVEIAGRLASYFQSGNPIGEIPWEWLDTREWTEFQRSVYSAIFQIPHGETRTYGWVAQKIGRLGATRAVGQALRNNPLPVLVPCHRVVSQDSLGGFMGCSNSDGPLLKLKSSLISIEDRYRQPVFPLLAVV